MDHHAFVPAPLPTQMPELSAQTYLAVANARAAIAALDSTARQLPNPTLLRRTTLQVEAQSTSALEGTYAPLSAVLTAEEDPPTGSDMREIQNYVSMADYAFRTVQAERPLTTGLLCELQRVLVSGTKAEGPETGRIRSEQVVVGRRPDAQPGEIPVKAARFIPSPPGPSLEADVLALVDWVKLDRSDTVDPIVSTAMAHYQFETLHPFHDGNGRIARMLVVLQLFMHGVLSEPTLSVSPWFEARRTEYYDHLLQVSCTNSWDDYVRFFATGIREAADATHRSMMSLVAVQSELKGVVRASRLRAENAHLLVDYAVGNVTFTVRGVERMLAVSYGRANSLVQQLVALGVLTELDVSGQTRRFYAPRVLEVLVAAR